MTMKTIGCDGLTMHAEFLFAAGTILRANHCCPRTYHSRSPCYDLPDDDPCDGVRRTELLALTGAQSEPGVLRIHRRA